MTLYTLDSKGKLRSWNVRWENMGDHSKIVVESGLVDGKKVVNETIIREGKNIGKINETTHWEQAHNESQALVEKMINKGYVTDPKDAKQGVKGTGVPTPMSASTYDPLKKQSGSSDLVGYKLNNREIIIQPKLDGIRRLFILDDTLRSYSRSGREVPIMEHMRKDIEQFIEDNGLRGVYLDGELYCEPSIIPFEELNGVCRQDEPYHPHIEEIKFHLFDIVSEKNYYQRFVNDRMFSDLEHFEIVPYVVTDGREETIEVVYEKYVSMGFEGIMIRDPLVGYENKRSKSLLKYKKFEDAEFLCTGVVEDKDGLAGSLVVQGDGFEFYPTIVSKDDHRRWLLHNQTEVVGKMVTVNFFGRSEEGVPRFPRYKALRYDIY